MQLIKDPVSGRYVMKIDASLYKEMDCMRYVLYKLIYGYVPPITGFKNPVTEYGTAFHKGLQARCENKSLEVQLKLVTDHFGQPEIVVPDNEWRNIGHLVNTYVAYDANRKMNGELIKPIKAEQRFAFPFYRTDKTEVLLCGTIDLDARYCDNLVLVDHKTTSAWNMYEYMAEYELSPQLMIYKYIYDKLYGTDVGCMINGIFISRTKPAQFKLSDVIRFSPQQIANVITHLMQRTIAIVEAFEAELDTGSSRGFIHNYCACIKRYGEKASPCMYKLICQQPTETDQAAVAESNFASKPYDPMTHQL